MKKRVMYGVLVVVGLLCLTGCGNDKTCAKWKTTGGPNTWSCKNAKTNCQETQECVEWK